MRAPPSGWSAFAAVLGFELRQQVRSPPFAVVTVISGLLVFGAVATERIRIGPAVGGLRNGPEAIAQLHLVWSLFFVFTAVAFATDAVLRDDQTRFAPVLRSSGLRKAPYLWGRFAGAFAAVALCFLSVPAGLLAASHAPWVDPAKLGPVLPGAYARALFLLALPNLFLVSALMFALATALRSSPAAYAGAVGLLLLYGLGSGEGGPVLPPLLEPFGFAALRSGNLPANRALWLGVGATALLASYARFSLRQPVGSVRHARRDAPDPPPAPASIRVRGRHDSGATAAQFMARLGWELRAVFTSAPFWVVVALGAANSGAALWRAAGDGADTLQLIARLIESFRLAPMAVAIFYAGELVWAERDAGVQPIVAASPAPDAVFLLPKLAALAAVLLSLLAATAAVGVGVDLAIGAPGADLGAWLGWYVGPRAYDWLLFAALAAALQAASPSKLAGWGWVVLYLISSLTLESLGLNNPLYRFGGRLDAPLAELLARPSGEAAPIRAYWASFAALLLVTAFAVQGRGEAAPLSVRFRRLSTELRRPGVAIAAITAAVLFVSSGALLAR